MKVTPQRKQVREKIVVGGIISDRQLLHSVYLWKNQYQEDLFLNQAYNQIIQWCFEHYAEKGECPSTKLLFTKYFEPWEEENTEDKSSNIAEAIKSAHDAWSSSNFRKDQLFDLAEDVLRRQQVLIASNRIGGTSSARLINDVVPGAVPVSLARESEYDNLFDDPRIALNILEAVNPVFTFKDDIVTAFYDDCFAPATFTSYLAPEKRGKSQWLLECMISALQCKKKVLFFDAGDMTEDQIFMRFSARAKNRPYKEGTQFIWNDLYSKGERIYHDVDVIEHQDRLSQKQYNRIKGIYSKMYHGKLFTRNFPRGSLTVNIMRSILDNLSTRGIQIDVLIIDYADILRPSKSKYSDNRHAVTEIWGDLRTLSMSYKVALITATQSDAESYNNELNQSSFSESKTKNAFITAEIGIDKTDFHEGIFKLSYVFRRTGSTSKAIYVASDLASYQPAKLAIWVPKTTDTPRKLGKVKTKVK